MNNPITQRKSQTADFNGKQNYEQYTTEDFKVWQLLFERQNKNLQNKASVEYLSALNKVGFSSDKIPDFNEVNKRLEKLTGWQIAVVPGIIPVDEFFTLLNNKKFPATTWLRKLSQLNYIEEPDMFHDVFGHIPLLSNPQFTDYAYGLSQLALKHINNTKIMEMLGRLYWFTLEFGLIQENEENKIYGAGIISSVGETKNALSSTSKKLPFNVKEIVNMPFRNDIIQDKYFVIISFEQLFLSLNETQKILDEKIALKK